MNEANKFSEYLEIEDSLRPLYLDILPGKIASHDAYRKIKDVENFLVDEELMIPFRYVISSEYVKDGIDGTSKFPYKLYKTDALAWVEGYRENEGKWNIRHRVDQDYHYENGDVSICEAMYRSVGVLIQSSPRDIILYSKHLPDFIKSFHEFIKNKL